jgi:hypothetical protein
MDLAQTARRYALLIILCTGILAGFFLLGNSWAPGTPGPATITPVPSGGNEIPAGVAVYCTVMEYDVARAADARVVPVTDDELRDFPEFQTRMNSSSNTVPWYNGARSTGDFIDCRNQFPAFWNLSCRNMS